MSDEFLIFNSYEFRDWLKEQYVVRPIERLLIHHTWKPDYSNFDGTNHRAVQAAMKRFHTIDRGWDDIGQHFTTLPDGTVVTGRPLEMVPACTKGANIGAICIENMGNFDLGGDVMTQAHADIILEASAWVCERWDIPVDSDHVLYHHWFDLVTGLRTDGAGETKSCPGTGFFGGNSVEAAEAFFLPQVYMKIESAAS